MRLSLGSRGSVAAVSFSAGIVRFLESVTAAGLCLDDKGPASLVSLLKVVKVRFRDASPPGGAVR